MYMTHNCVFFRAMLRINSAYVVVRCLAGCLSVTFVIEYVKTAKDTAIVGTECETVLKLSNGNIFNDLQ